MFIVRGLAASAGVWLSALNWRSVLHQQALAHGQLYFTSQCNTLHSICV